jgi:hypothetical protein
MGLECHEGRHIIIDLLFFERHECNASILQYFPRCDFGGEDGISLP